jgi:hypothetical protein
LTEPPRGDREAGARPPILVVSGLPRSGTSLMLQMLQAGGVPVLTDGRRAADEDNPEGYFEWEPIQTMAGRPACLAAAAGQAVKVVSPLLRALPADGCYQVLFMLRPLTEVVRSQLRMRARLGKGAGDPRWLAEQLRQHLRDALAWLRTQPQVAVLPVSYGGLVGAAARWSARVVGFLGRERVPHPERMAAVVRPELYRQRARVPGDGVHARQRGGWFRQSQ